MNDARHVLRQVDDRARDGALLPLDLPRPARALFLTSTGGAACAESDLLAHAREIALLHRPSLDHLFARLFAALQQLRTIVISALPSCR
jgi:enoyl-CoA hydratase/carnithine racemase